MIRLKWKSLNALTYWKISKSVPALASGFEQDNSVLPMLGVTGSRAQFRKPKKFLEV